MPHSPIKTILWDLDGTLAVWKSLYIVKHVSSIYFSLLSSDFNSLKVILAVIRAYKRVLKNTGPYNNDALFNRTLSGTFHVSPSFIRQKTDEMLKSDELRKVVKEFVQPIPEGLKLVQLIAEKSALEQVVATNPVMPSEFNRLRLEEAGYSSNLFKYITGTEEFYGQKKSVAFYHRLLAFIGLRPEECLMVGNDPLKDAVAKEAGIKVFLLNTKYLVKRENPNFNIPDGIGDYADLKKFIFNKGCSELR
ncbi:MAG: HAD family hydrolase [Candidatus Riflebacteria bacterium]|nr:HAD family hydrolase [Candidatus Riflebacteria bacterium]